MENKQSERQNYRRAVIAEQAVSGKAVRDFCRERDLGEASFCWWRHRLRKDEPVPFAFGGDEAGSAGWGSFKTAITKVAELKSAA